MKRINLDDLPQIYLDTTDESADWIRMNSLSFYDEGMSIEEFRTRLDEHDVQLEDFLKTPTYRAALERGEPEWIADL